MTDTKTAPDAEAEDLGITELVEFDPTRLDGVKSAATGIPFLIMKSAAEPTGEPAGPTGEPAGPAPVTLEVLAKAMSGGQVDEAPDISTGRQIMTLLARAISGEADEVGAGHYGEVADIRMLARGVDLISCWIARKKAVQAGQDPDMACGCCEWCSGIGCGCCPGCGAGMVMCSAADEALEAAKASAAISDLPDSAFAYIEAGGKKDDSGKTTPRSLRHFPVHDKAHAQEAVRLLSASPFGPKARSKVMAAAKKFGAGIAGDDDASKSGAVAEGEDDVQTDTQGTGEQIAKLAGDAVTKAIKPLEDRLSTVEADMAKVKAAPIHGGPVLSANARPQQGGDVRKTELIVVAEEAERLAEVSSDPNQSARYSQLAAQKRAEAAKA